MPCTRDQLKRNSKRLISGLLLFSGGLFSSTGYCLSEGEFTAFAPQKLSAAWEKGIPLSIPGEPEKSPATPVTLKGRVWRAENSKGTLFFVPGRAEPARKYSEFVLDFSEQGFDIVIFDVRGQGESTRLLEEPQKDHMDSFALAVKDVEHILIAQAWKKPFVIFGHSMGGAIVARTLQLNHTRDIAGAILSAPMLHANTAPYPRFAAKGLGEVASYLGQAERFAFGKGPYRIPHFENNAMTSSFARFNWVESLFQNHPTLQVGGPTFGWVKEGLEFEDEILKAPEKIEVPLLVFTNGADRTVHRDYVEAFCARQPKCQLQFEPQARHNVFMERDVMRDKAVSEVKKFLNTRFSASKP